MPDPKKTLLLFDKPWIICLKVDFKAMCVSQKNPDELISEVNKIECKHNKVYLVPPVFEVLSHSLLIKMYLLDIENSCLRNHTENSAEYLDPDILCKHHDQEGCHISQQVAHEFSMEMAQSVLIKLMVNHTTDSFKVIDTLSVLLEDLAQEACKLILGQVTIFVYVKRHGSLNSKLEGIPLKINVEMLHLE